MALETLQLIKERLAKRPAEIVQAKQAGAKVLGWSGYYIPEEIIYALGFIPIQVGKGGDDRLVEIGARYISTGNCVYVREIMGLIAQNVDPYIQTIDAYAFDTACLQTFRVAELVEFYFSKDVFVLGIPRNFEWDAAKDYLRGEVGEFTKQLEEKAGTQLDLQKLAEAVALYNKIRKNLKNLYDYQALVNNVISWVEVYDIIQAGYFLDKKEYLGLLEQVVNEIESRKSLSVTVDVEEEARIFLSGSVIPPGDRKLIDIIVQAGGRIVGDDLWSGIIPYLNLTIEEITPDGIALGYLNRTPHASLPYLDLETDKRLKKLHELIDEYAADGVIYHTLRYCDPYTFKAKETKDVLTKSHIPFLEIHTEYAGSDFEAIRTRVEAFIEMIKLQQGKGGEVMSKPPYRYNEEYREQFLQSSNITFRDGSIVTPAEIWEYLTQVAPKKFPYVFEAGTHYGGRASMDVTLPAALKNTYLNLTLAERMEIAKDKGEIIVYVQGGQAIDPYTAAGVRALRPATANGWSRGRHIGKNVNQIQLIQKTEKEKAYRDTSFEACATAGYEQIQEDDLRFDLIAPFGALRCADITYSLEAHRHGRRKGELKLFLVDYPLSKQGDKKWAIEYFAQNLRKLVETIDEITGKKTTEEDLRAALALHNQGRKLSHEIAKLWWSADRPPTNGADRLALFTMGALECHGDVQATLSVLKEARDSIADRVKNDIKGHEVADHPKRLFVCGACVSPNTYRTEEAGAIIVGKDDHWSNLIHLVEEEGDPYYNLAKTTLDYPYEQSPEARAAWTIEQVKNSKADGLLFLYNWGCNTQSAVARTICDIVKRETGLPTLVSENEMRGTQSEQQANRTNAFIEMVG